MSLSELGKMKQSLEQIDSLIQEVAEGMFIPKRFRKAPFTPKIRDEYVSYLKRERDGLRFRVSGMSKALGVPYEGPAPVAVGAPVRPLVTPIVH